MTPPTETDRADIERRVIEMVKSQFNADGDVVDGMDGPLTLASRFREDIGADSLDSIELAMEAEDEFAITIIDAEAERVVTVGDAVNLVMEIMGR